MSHQTSSAYGGPSFTSKKQADNWIKVKAGQVKKGQCIQWHDDKINEVIDVLLWGNEKEKEEAKANSREKRNFCIVMDDPRADERGFIIPLLHCTKAVFSRYKDQIYRPLPHHSKDYKAYLMKREPLETVEGSPEHDSQTYVVPYEIFYAKTRADYEHQVRDLSILSEVKQLTRLHVRSSKDFD